MSKFNKTLFFLLVFIIGTSGLKAQSEAAPSQGAHAKIQNIQNKRLLPVEFVINIADSILAYDPNLVGDGNAGIIFFNGEFWVSKWASNQIVILDSFGSVDTLITITGLSGTRSFTTDGVSIFAGNATDNIYAINPSTRSLDSTIVLPASSVGSRMTAYDASADNGNGGFWIANFTSAVELYSRSGILLQTIPQTTHGVNGIYGGSVDTITPGGPYLALYNQGVVDQSRIDYINLSTGLPAGIAYDTHFDLNYTQTANPNPGIAGGLFISDNYNPNHQVIMGVMQGLPDILFGYENLIYNCSQSTNLTATAISSSEVELNWTAGSGSNWKIEYGPSGFTLGTGTSFVTASNPDTISALAINTLYDIYIEDSCAPGQLSFWSGPANAMIGYCIPAPTSVDGSGITNVSVGTINNPSLTETNNYGDYSNLVTDVARSTTVNVDITYSTGLTYETRVWVDWNNDLDFDDLGEEVFAGTSANTNPATITATFQIPLNAVLDTLRMRIGGADLAIPTPCYTGSWASYEDYSLNILPAPSCMQPTLLYANNVLSNSAQVGWTENNLATQWIIEYGISGFNLGAGTSDTVTSNPSSITGLNSNTLYEFYVRSICGRNDSSVWSGPFQFYTPCTAVSNFPYTEDFDGSTVNGIWSCWIDYNIDGGNTWTQASTYITPHSSPYTAHGMGNNNDMLISPQFILPTNPMWLKLWDIVEGSTQNNTYSILVSTTGYDTLDFTDTLATYNVTNTTWTERTIDLSAYANQSIYIAIWQSYSASSFWGFGIDDFKIEQIPTCLKPTNLTASNILSTSADLGWTENNLATQWIVEYGTSGFTRGTGISDTVTSMPASISGLSPNTLYEYYVQSVCGRNDSSTWSGPFQFYTPCSAVTTFPYSENFDGSIVNSVWNCWTIYNIDGGNTWSQANTYITARSAPYTAHGMGNNNDMLISPQFILPSNPMWLKLWDIVEGSTQNNTYSILVSTTGYDTLDFTDTLATYNVTNTTWTERTIDLSAYANQSIYIALWQSYSASSSWGFGIDDFTIEEIPSCVKPTNLFVSNLTANSADLNWTENNIATEWVIEYGTSGFNLGNGTKDTVLTNPASISGLNPNTSYEFYVRSVCGRNDSSQWAGPFLFVTPCVAVTAFPYIQDFSTFVPSCWEEAGDGTPATGPSNFGFGDWNAGNFLNNAANGSGVKINLFSNTRDEWIISEPFDLSGAGSQPYEVRLKAGVTDWLNQGPDNMGIDDEVQILISTDGGITWTNLYTWNVNNQPSNTGTIATVSLASYSGTNNIFAIYATDGTIGGPEDYDFHVDDFEIRITPTCMEPTSIASVNISTNSAEIGWVEQNSSTEWIVQYGLNGFNLGMGTIDTTISNPYLINGLLPSTNYQFYVKSVCSAMDTSAWAGPFSFATLCDTIQVYPYLEDFSMYVPMCWEVAGDGTPLTGPTNFGTSNWASGSYLNDASNGNGVKINLYFNTRDEWIISEPFDLSASTSQPYELKLDAAVTNWLSSAPDNMGSDDEVQILISTDAGLTWNTLYTWNVNNQPANTGSTATVSLSGYTGNHNIFAIYATDGTVDDSEDYDFHVDNFVVRITPSCMEPISISSVNITTNSADIAWVEQNAATEWIVQYGLNGFVLGTGTMDTISSNPYLLNGLQASTNYHFYVRSICSSTDTSYWAGPYSFATLCDTITAYPFLEDFNTFVPLCWDQADNGTPLSGPSNFGASAWESSDFLNNASNGSGVVINLYTNSRQEWIISESFNLSNSLYDLRVKAGVTDWLSTAADNMGSDDVVHLMISTDGGLTWSILYTWDVNNQPANTGSEVSIPLHGYNGNHNIFAIWASDGAINDAEDYDFHVDKFQLIEVPPIDPAITALIAPVNDITYCYSNSESVIVELQNMGADSLDFAVDTAFVTVSVTGAATATLIDTVSDNSINAGKLGSGNSIALNLGNIDMSNPGSYNFNVSMTMASDGKLTNNTFAESILVSANSGGLISGLDSICAGDTVKLSVDGSVGNIQWQSATAGVFTDILGADATELMVFPNSPTSYRVVSCGTVYSDTLMVEPVTLNQPLAFDSMLVVTCGNPGVVALVATSINPNATFEWFDVANGGTALTVGGNIVSISSTGDTLYYQNTSSTPNNPAVDTFYVQEYFGSANAGVDSLMAVPFTGGNGCGAGNMFDIIAATDLEITGFSINSNTVGAQVIDVYIKQGTYLNAMTNASAWTLVESVNVIGNGSGVPSYVDLSNFIAVDNGDTIGVYINFNAAYTNVTLGSAFSNSDMSIIMGHGVCTPFTTGNAGRGFNGEVFYSKGYGCVSSRDTAIANIDCIVGVDENTSALSSISIYPNPSKGAFSIVGKDVRNEIEISIYNSNGKLVYQSSDKLSNNFEERIDISGLAKGLYFVKLQSKDAMETIKVVVQ